MAAILSRGRWVKKLLSTLIPISLTIIQVDESAFVQVMNQMGTNDNHVHLHMFGLRTKACILSPFIWKLAYCQRCPWLAA